MNPRAYGDTQLESEVPGTMRCLRRFLAVLVLKVRSPLSPRAYGDSQPEAIWLLSFGFRISSYSSNFISKDSSRIELQIPIG